MKRHNDTSLPEGHEKLRRQEPVSCQFCRRKKLKCDRGSPCSNCRARKLNCASVGSVVAQISQNPAGVSPNQVIEDLNARVKRLESLIASAGIQDPGLPSRTPANVASAQTTQDFIQPDPHDAELTKTTSWLDVDAFEHQPPISQSSTDEAFAEQFMSFVVSLTVPRTPPAFKQQVVRLLPCRAQGEMLLEYYFEHINWIYHVIHVPTVKKIFHTLYSNIEQNQLPNLGHLSLISALFALSAYFCSATSKLYFKVGESKVMCHRWTLLAQDALSAADCLNQPTVETFQTLILISNHIFPNTGALVTIRILTSIMVYAAQGLSLHLTDSEANKKNRMNTQVDWVDIEVRRRLWWHVVATDWILCFMSGVQCGHYNIPPNHMAVEYPSNVDDERITADGNYAQPDHVNTELSYFRFRIKIAIAIREMADDAWNCSCSIDELPYEAILQFDKKFSSFLIDPEHDLPSQGSNSDVALLAKQHDMVSFGTHTRLSRLHRPYLARGARDPKFAYSRMVCLRSARTVIEIGKRMMTYTDDLMSLRYWCVNHHIFVATVILVMDYCFNREEPRAKARKEEILDAFRLLEGVPGESTIATRGLWKLRKLLGERPMVKETKPGTIPLDTDGAKSDVLKNDLDPPSSSGLQAPNSSDFVFQGSNQLSLSYSDEPFAGSNLESPSFQEWHNFNFSDIGNINFDVDVDFSQFEPLFFNDEFNPQIF